ncbi:hypothetical protein LJ655_08225 [Paraburkholderia sp. MMS20-SJTN17]|uniref:Uncharacterized protein n=1 Tax=Paraburkholderia translucens TaxID=2886945 RepID=A0ABS8KBS9_9BURK|nr:hypothetical protein [Paraburkholderia sp. MMS20-SJTN17]MCC8401877.1 hypothetical protein [Paraburkholderia sp. MMS20-SJTN17]
MKALIQSFRRFPRAPFWVRAPVGLLALTAAIQIKDLLDIVWSHFHVNQFVADIVVQTAFAPVVVTLIAPMLSFLAPLFHGERSGKARRFDDSDPLDRGIHDDSWDSSGRPDPGADWYTDPSYSWFSGNIFHDDTH